MIVFFTADDSGIVSLRVVSNRKRVFTNVSLYALLRCSFETAAQLPAAPFAIASEWSSAWTSQGLKGVRIPHPVNENLESDTWYQISAVSERAQGVFCEPVFAVAKTHREPARVIEIAGNPVQGSTDSINLHLKLDCSSTPTNEACGLLR